MVNVLYNEYCDSDEVTSEISLMKESLAIDKLVLAYNTLMEQEELNLREAELNCMMESGDIDTLAQFYEDATEEIKEKKDNIFKRIWKAICNFFSRLKETIFGSKQMKKLDEDAKNNEEYGLDEKGEESFKLIKTLKDKIGKPTFDVFKKFKDQSIWKIILEIVGAGLAGGAVALTVHNCKKVKAGEIHGIKEWAAEWSNVFKEGFIDKAVDLFTGKNKVEVVDTDGNVVSGQGIIQKIKDAIRKIIDWIKKIIPFGKGKDNGKDNDLDDNALPGETYIGIEKKEKVKTYANLSNNNRKKYDEKKEEITKKYGNDGPTFIQKMKELNKEFNLPVTESVIEYFADHGIFLEASELDSYINGTYDDPFELDDMFAESSSTDIDDVYDLLDTL